MAPGADSGLAMHQPHHCQRCALPKLACVCSILPVIANRTRVTIVRHYSERFRSSNTGRLASLALANCEVLDYGAPASDDSLYAAQSIALHPLAGAMLLFPTGEVRTSPPDPLPPQLIVLDATWSQARRMWQRLDVLRGLPTLRLPEVVVAVPRMRKSPGPGHVSTIEAIAAALRLLEGDAIAAPLEDLFFNAVDRMRAIGRNGIAQRSQ